MKYYYKILFFSLVSAYCKNPEQKPKTNTIVFSCIYCKGCVENNVRYIIEKQLDRKYTIIADTNCFKQDPQILKGLHVFYMDKSKIKNEYGEFGNFILLDSTGNRTEFLTDMHLNQFIR